MTSQATGPEQARATVSPSAVREAALTLFAERGYHGTALSQIAGELGIRTPSLYNHMRSKHDLLEAIVSETTEQVWSDYEDAVRGIDDPVEGLRRAITTYALRHATHRREALIVNRDISSLEGPARTRVFELRRRHEHAIRTLIEEGVAQQRMQVDRPALASFGILEMCVSIARWYRDDGALTPEDVAEQHGEFALRIAGAQPPG